jgi:imidazolonepropionase-like amidohydrolase
MRLGLLSSLLLLPASAGWAQPPKLQRYLSVDAARVILEHVTVIDGTGGPAERDRNLHIEGGKISRISAGADEPAQAGTAILDLHGRSVLPGIVGMHEHLFCYVRPNLKSDSSFEGPAMFQQMTYSAPRLYLALGVTTLRTAGSIEPGTDLKLKRAIDRGDVPGPNIDVTGPYLDGPGNALLQVRALSGAEDARQTVAYWAERGVTSFKAYNTITREELRAAVEEAHRRGLKVTGHLCSVTYPEAVEAGIDNLEHGFSANTELDPEKLPDQCSESRGDYTLEHLEPGSAAAVRLIALLVEHHVAITSTLPSAASRFAPAEGRPALPPAALSAMAPALREAYLYGRNRPADQARLASDARLLRIEMELERAFVAAGGLLIAGADPVGVGGVLPGFGDHREIELLVEAGFTPLQAIRIATLNGAIYLGRQDRIGSIAVGKNADLLVVKGDPAARIQDIENVEIVFKDGAGYDPSKLLDSVAGHYGQY